MLPRVSLGCQDAADHAFPLKSTGILSEQSMQGQILYNTFKKAYDGPTSSMLMIISYILAYTFLLSDWLAYFAPN